VETESSVEDKRWGFKSNDGALNRSYIVSTRTDGRRRQNGTERRKDIVLSGSDVVSNRKNRILVRGKAPLKTSKS
jgi:hypothetical protein